MPEPSETSKAEGTGCSWLTGYAGRALGGSWGPSK